MKELSNFIKIRLLTFLMLAFIVLTLTGCSMVKPPPDRRTLLGIIVILAVITAASFIFRTLKKHF